jgi:hypothetical protein
VWAVARCLLLALDFLLLSSRPFLLATILVALLNVAVIALWDHAEPVGHVGPAFPAFPRPQAPLQRLSALAVASIATLVIFTACRAWIHEILIFPHDSQRADMLVVIQLGIRRLLQGRNPYTMYHVPWPVPLPYGIVMWAPMLVPHFLHADVRFATLLGALFVPSACGAAAFVNARRGRHALALSWLAVMAAIAFNPELRGFVSIGHTPAYWPLLALFAWLVGRERWHSAALVGGLLIVARTTMASMAPVLLMAVWHRSRPRVPGVVALMAAGALLPFLPFAVADWTALRYALYGSYQSTMKGFVWVSTEWVQHTIGITGLLLARRWQNAVEPVQIIVMLAVYAGAWLAIHRDRRPLPWLAFALLAFSMTTLWPVIYLYFDVFLLLVSGALAEEAVIQRERIALVWAGAAAASLVVLISSAWAIVPIDASIDAGSSGDRPFLYAGFANDERGTDRTFAWIEGTSAEILVPRRSRADTTIDLTVEPNLPTPDTVQQMSVALNGTVLGTVTLKDGWQTVSFAAPSRAWQVGVNEVILSFSTAVSPFEAGLGADTRRLSAAIDRLNVRTR